MAKSAKGVAGLAGYGQAPCRLHEIALHVVVWRSHARARSTGYDATGNWARHRVEWMGRQQLQASRPDARGCARETCVPQTRCHGI